MVCEQRCVLLPGEARWQLLLWAPNGESPRVFAYQRGGDEGHQAGYEDLAQHDLHQAAGTEGVDENLQVQRHELHLLVLRRLQKLALVCIVLALVPLDDDPRRVGDGVDVRHLLLAARVAEEVEKGNGLLRDSALGAANEGQEELVNADPLLAGHHREAIKDQLSILNPRISHHFAEVRLPRGGVQELRLQHGAVRCWHRHQPQLRLGLQLGRGLLHGGEVLPQHRAPGRDLARHAGIHIRAQAQNLQRHLPQDARHVRGLRLVRYELVEHRSDDLHHAARRDSLVRSGASAVCVGVGVGHGAAGHSTHISVPREVPQDLVLLPELVEVLLPVLHGLLVVHGVQGAQAHLLRHLVLGVVPQLVLRGHHQLHQVRGVVQGLVEVPQAVLHLHGALALQHGLLASDQTSPRQIDEPMTWRLVGGRIGTASVRQQHVPKAEEAGHWQGEGKEPHESTVEHRGQLEAQGVHVNPKLRLEAGHDEAQAVQVVHGAATVRNLHLMASCTLRNPGQAVVIPERLISGTGDGIEDPKGSHLCFLFFLRLGLVPSILRR
mmetsp:Transcript_34169/g.81990  ORF Transcript_34169/g.81990 Transcript_34169/m.81990 type:complete len:550 (-) Transcript_34169:2348-3997(-)